MVSEKWGVAGVKLLGEGGSVLQVVLVGGRRGEIQRCPDMLQGSLKSSPALGRSPGEGNGQRRLAGYSPWGRKESEVIEHTCRSSKEAVFHGKARQVNKMPTEKKSVFRYTEKFTTTRSSELQIRIQANTSRLHSPTHGTGWSCVVSEAAVLGKTDTSSHSGRKSFGGEGPAPGEARGRETLFSSPLTSDRKLAYLPGRQLG